MAATSSVSSCSFRPLQAGEPQHSLTPFQLIYDLASNHLDRFLHMSPEEKKELFLDASHPYRERTSCVNNAYAVLRVFLGKEVASAFMKICNLQMISLFCMSLPSGKKYYFAVENLLLGDALIALQKERPGAVIDLATEREVFARYEQAAKQKFLEYIQPLVEHSASDEQWINACENMLTNLRSTYNFNSKTIRHLREEILENEKEIRSDLSCIYLVDLRNSTREENGDASWRRYHIFVIEQFLAQDEVRYRIYQSMIEASTLFEDFERSHYEKSGEGALNREGIEKFLGDLMTYYGLCRHQTGLHPFGYGAGIPHSLVYFEKRLYQNQDGNPLYLPALAGISFSYLSRKINPRSLPCL